MGELLLDLLWIFILYTVIGVLWTWIERVMYGKEKPKILHDFIAIILATSIYLNIIG